MTVALPVASLELEEAHLDDKYLKLGSIKIETAEEVRQSHPCRKKHFITASSTPAAASTTPKGASCTVPGLSPKPNYFGLAARCGRCSRNGVLVDAKSRGIDGFQLGTLRAHGTHLGCDLSISSQLGFINQAGTTKWQICRTSVLEARVLSLFRTN